jgi:hypothetical protein
MLRYHRADRGEPVTESPRAPALFRSGAMEDQSYLREQADRCRCLARDSQDLNLKISLRKLADEYQLRADELENDEIFRETVEPRRSHGQ